MHPHFAGDVGEDLWPLSNSTRNMALGSDSTIVPSARSHRLSYPCVIQSSDCVRIVRFVVPQARACALRSSVRHGFRQWLGGAGDARDPATPAVMTQLRRELLY